MIFYLFFLLTFSKETNYALSPAHLIKEESLTCEKLKLGPSLDKFCKNLKDMVQLIFFKLAKMDKLKKIEKNFNPYMYLYKENQQFYLETFLYIDTTFKMAEATIKDYNSYGSWILNNYNTSKISSKEKPFLSVTGMSFDKITNIFKIYTELDFVFKNKYVLALDLKDSYDRDYAKQVNFKITKPTEITPDIKGTFIFYEIPDSNFMILYFYGYTKLHWLVYNALPLQFLEVYVREKIEIMYENIGYKVEELKENHKENLKNEENLITNKNIKESLNKLKKI